MEYSYGETSNERLNTAHEDLQKIFRLAIKRSMIDIGIAEGNRSVEKQLEYFNAGKSRIDGIKKKGKHNYMPSLAVDFYAYYNGKANWDLPSLCYIAGVLTSVAEELYSVGEISHLIRWGANWDNDGVILTDQSFDDAPHVELYKPK
jgi:peptidoglycan L-alanyl-D-glutamate endopeptidase CwlK